MDSIIESWTCQIEGDLTTFFENLHADVTAVWMHSSIGHRVPGCKPVRGERGAYFTFNGDTGALAAIAAEVYRPGRLSVVIERYKTKPEDVDPDYIPWAVVGEQVTTWLRGWVKEHYASTPTPQRAGSLSWDYRDEPTTPDQVQEVESLTPEAIETALAPLRDTPEYWPELERLVRAYWAQHGRPALPISGKRATWTIEKITGYGRSRIYRETNLRKDETQ